MTAVPCVQDFLAQKRFAFVGLSRDSADFSRALFREFQSQGYDPVPVHPDASEMEGRPCFAHLADIQPPVEGALFMTPPAITDKLVPECAAAGIRRVWMFRGAGRGAATPDAIRFCQEQGMSVVPGECPFMFLPSQPWFHGLHGFVRKFTR